MHDMPQDPAGITPAWLTAALRKGGVLRDAAVTSLELTTIGEGSGFIGQLVRITPVYDLEEEGSPRSIVAKMPGASEGGRQIGNLFDFYHREIRFYEEIAEGAGIRTPARYYSEADRETQRYILLIEDLAPARCGDQAAGCTPEEAQLAVESIARFHAQWWESPRLADIAAWMPAINAPVQQVAAGAYAQAWQPFLNMFGETLSPAVREACERIGENVVKIQTAFASPPLTISHGDYRIDNLFFVPAGELAVADWQISTLARGTFDVAYLLCGGLAPALRREHERRLVSLYHDTLVAHGVRGYSPEECWDDYRLGALFQFVYIVIATGTLDPANERGMALWRVWLERGAAAVEDLNAIECMPA